MNDGLPTDTLGSAWDAWRFNHNHAAAGQANGGQFIAASGSSSSSSKKTGPKGRKTTTSDGRPHGESKAELATKRRLIAQADADRAQARVLEARLHAAQQQEKAAKAAAAKAATAAKNARKNPSKVAAAKKAAASKKATTHHRTLKQHISSLQERIHTLLTDARALEQQASRI